MNNIYLYVYVCVYVCMCMCTEPNFAISIDNCDSILFMATSFASNSAFSIIHGSIGLAAEMQIFARAAELWSWVPAKATIFSLNCLEN